MLMTPVPMDSVVIKLLWNAYAPMLVTPVPMDSVVIALFLNA